MYLYLVDTFAQDKKFQRDLLHIQARIQDLGINGRFEKLTMLKSIQDIVNDAERKGVKTIVAIGNDKTFNAIVSHLTNNSITLGLVPLGEENNTIAKALHIPVGEAACTILSKRIIQRLDVGKINGRYFFSSLSIFPSRHMKIECDNSYILKTSGLAPIRIINFCDDRYRGNAQDGKLETIVEEIPESGLLSFFGKKQAGRNSIIPTTNMRIKSTDESLPIYSGTDVVVKTPATIEIIPKKLRVISGA